MTKKKQRFLSLAVSVLLVSQSIPTIPTGAEDDLSLNVSTPFPKDTNLSLGNGDSIQSSSYRIPAMVTLKDGTIVAASDIRWNTTYDGGGLDTMVARSTDGGVSWEYTLANYLGDNGDTYNGSSTCFIDPSLAVAADGQTVYMLVDLYPYGVALNGSKETTPSTAVGFTDDGYLKLSNDNHSSYAYYLKNGEIYRSSNNAKVAGYTVDEYFNLYQNGTLKSNLFYSDSPYKVVRTGYLYLTSSVDGGESWSAPALLDLKTASENVCLVGPGRGITTSDGTMVFPVYSYGGTEGSQRMGFVYSQDGITWKREQSDAAWSSEAAVVEIGEGTLRFFYRNGTTNLTYVDYNMTSQTWGYSVNTGVKVNSNTQLSAITYSKTSNGKQVVLVSCPIGPGSNGSSSSDGSNRLNGRIFAATVESDGTMSWNEPINVNGMTAYSSLSGFPYQESQGFFAYSCLTERSDGSIAVLYENTQNGWGSGSSYYFTMNMKAYSASDLGLDFGTSPDIPVPPSDEITSKSVTVSSNSVSFTGLTVTAAEAPSASYMENALAYNVLPETEDGIYNGSAQVTIDLPNGWEPSKVFGFVTEPDGTVTVLAGHVSDGRITFTTPHFYELGIFEATDLSNVTEVTVILPLGESTEPILVSDSALIGTAGTHTASDGTVRYTVTHRQSSGGFELDSDGIDSGSQYLITLNGTYAAATYSSSYNDWYTNSLPLRSINLNGTSDLSDYLWTVTKTSGGYYIQAPNSQYMTIQTGTNANKNYTVTLSNTPFVCDIVESGSGYMIFADGTNIGLNNAGGSNKTALGWTSSNNTVWMLYNKPDQTSTSVAFSGLNATSGTDITLGSTTYTVIVQAKDLTVPLVLCTDSSTSLDAMGALGVSGSGYTVSYVKTADENGVITLTDNIITSSDNIGEAEVVATVSDASGNTVATVTYQITVANIIIDSYKSIYVPVNGTATMEGLSGTIRTDLLDESIAVHTENADGSITFTGISDGKTALIVGTTQINVYVNPENTGSGADSSKYIYINLVDLDNCTVYYSINGGTLHPIEGEGPLIDQTYNDGFNIIFFAVPHPGYALTHMAAPNSSGQYYPLSNGTAPDGTDSSAWPFNSPNPTSIPTDSSDGAWKSGHGYRWSLMQGNITIDGMKDLFTRALLLNADATTTFTKNDSSALNTDISFIAERLPTMEKTILDVNGAPYAEGTILEFGDRITYQFTITSHSSNITYSDIVLKDEMIGYLANVPADNLNSGGTFVDTATYTVNANDIDLYENGVFQNNVTLDYKFTSSYSTGSFLRSDTAAVSCKIAGIVYYVWMNGTPDAITDNPARYPLPSVEKVTYGKTITVQPYSGETTYTVVENGTVVGTWNFLGWKYGEAFFPAGSTLPMPQNDSVEFVGIWEFNSASTYRVIYSWTNPPSEAVLPADPIGYYIGQTYQVDNTYTPGFVIDTGSTTWTFSGWMLEDEIVEGTQIMGEGNVILFGHWTENAKFTSLTVSKDGYSEYENLDPNQTFLFRITGNGVDLTLTVHGEESVTVTGLCVGSIYTVTELGDWSWRYEPDTWMFVNEESSDTGTGSDPATVILAENNNEIRFTNKRTEILWLDGDTYAVNIFTKTND